MAAPIDMMGLIHKLTLGSAITVASLLSLSVMVIT